MPRKLVMNMIYMYMKPMYKNSKLIANNFYKINYLIENVNISLYNKQR